jgi:DNA polymerase-1
MQSKYQAILDSLTPGKQETFSPNDNVLIVDSMNTFLRCFAVTNHINPQNEHTGALSGFLKSVGYAIRMIKPTKVILAFEGQGSITNKRYLYPEYKSNRDIRQVINWTFESKEEESEAMASQLMKLVEYLKLLPVHSLSIDRLEADDIIGYLSVNLPKKVTIMSADQDFLQLVNNNITVYSPTKKKFYTPELVLQEYGILAENFLYYKVLMGDKSDNIPGIKGLGDKKLIKLYPEFSKTPIDIKHIKETAVLKQKENILYEKIIERDLQLDVNLKLMNLREPIIPDNDKIILQEVINTSNSNLDIVNFKKLYKTDVLEQSILNIDSWLENNFRYLTTFK